MATREFWAKARRELVDKMKADRERASEAFRAQHENQPMPKYGHVTFAKGLAQWPGYDPIDDWGESKAPPCDPNGLDDWTWLERAGSTIILPGGDNGDDDE